MATVPDASSVGALVPCPRCEGACTVQVCVVYPGGDYGLYDAPCYACSRRGRVTERQALRLKAEMSTALSEMDRDLRRAFWRNWGLRGRTREATEFVVSRVKM